jgi:hypothetical protein
VSGLRIGAYIGFGVALVGGGLGTYFLIKSSSTKEEADDLFTKSCPNKTCSAPVAAEITDLDSTYDTQRNVGAASLIVGGVGLATGVTLLILDLQKGSKSASEPSLQPIVGLGYTGLRGTF